MHASCQIKCQVFDFSILPFGSRLDPLFYEKYFDSILILILDVSTRGM